MKRDGSAAIAIAFLLGALLVGRDLMANGPFGGGGGSSGLVSGTTTITGGADKSICFDDGGAVNCADAGGTFTKATGTLGATIIDVGTSGDGLLNRDAAGVVAHRNGTNAQGVRVYGTFTNSTNYERSALGFGSVVCTGFGATTAVVICSESAGTGSPRALYIGTDGSANLNLVTQANTRYIADTANNFYPNSDNSGTFGVNGNRVRAVYTGTYTVGTLPTCNAGAQGAVTAVTDHNAACALNATATAGGANICHVFCNGTNWIIG